MTEFRHTRLISEYDSATGKFINYLELGDTSTTPDTPVDLRFRVPGYIENVHTIYFEGDHGESPEAGISTSKPSGVVHDLVFFDPQNASGKTLSELVTSGGETLWESSTADETYLTTPEPVNLKGQPLRGSSESGGDLLLVANSVNSGTIYCQDTLDVQGNDICDVHDFYMHDTGSWDYLNIHNPVGDPNGDKVLIKLMSYSAVGMTPAASLGMQNAYIDMGGNKIDAVDVIKANDAAGIDCCYSGGTSMLHIATSSYSFVANANASMNTHRIINVQSVSGTYNSTSTYDELSIRNQANNYDIATFSYKVIDELAVADLDMLGHHIAGLAVADTNGHAVEYSQLAGYAPISHTHTWGDITSGVPAYCTRWSSWSEVSSKPSTLEYTTHKNVADGYCGIGSDGYMPTIALLPSMITGSLYVANNLNTMAELSVGTTNGDVLTIDSAQTLGVKWATPTESTGIWQDMGTYVQLIAADNLSMRSMYISNLHDDPQYGTDAVNKNYVDGFLKLTGGTLSGDFTVPNGHQINAQKIQAVSGYVLDLRNQAGIGGIRISTTNIMHAILDLHNYDVIGINTIKGYSTHDLKFYDAVLNDTVTLSELAAGGGSTYWEAVDANTIRPIGHHTIQGIDSNDLYIKPASGKVLYLG